VECVPQGALDSTEPEDWKTVVDQDILPDWFKDKAKQALLKDFKSKLLAVIGMMDWSTIGGFLNLRGTQVKSLPSGLKVGGSLDLRGTQVKSLPSGLKTIGGFLDLGGTQVKSLPSGLKVGSFLYLQCRQTELLKEVKKRDLAYQKWDLA
jgi:hypothetical protein